MTKANAEMPDPIVEEIHAIRQQLHDESKGDLHAYSLAATANALALGFKFCKLEVPLTEPSAKHKSKTFDMTNLAGRLSWKGDAVVAQREQLDTLVNVRMQVRRIGEQFLFKINSVALRAYFCRPQS